MGTAPHYPIAFTLFGPLRWECCERVDNMPVLGFTLSDTQMGRIPQVARGRSAEAATERVAEDQPSFRRSVRISSRFRFRGLGMSNYGNRLYLRSLGDPYPRFHTCVGDFRTAVDVPSRRPRPARNHSRKPFDITPSRVRNSSPGIPHRPSSKPLAVVLCSRPEIGVGGDGRRRPGPRSS
jgi:hypothetical protein